MIKKVFMAWGLVTLLLAIVMAFRLQSNSTLGDEEFKALPADLRDAAAIQRDTRVRMQGKSWVFAFQGDNDSVTTGDVEKAKLELALAGKK